VQTAGVASEVTSAIARLAEGLKSGDDDLQQLACVHFLTAPSVQALQLDTTSTIAAASE
jgi:hypothetical protein